jgi:hypothetical protein
MDGRGLREAAASTVGDLDVDPDEVLNGVYRRHRRRNLLRASGGAVVAAGFAFALVTGVSGPASSPVTTEGELSAPTDPTEVVELPAYTMSASSEAGVLATVDGVELTYLPPGLPTEPSYEGTGTTGADEAYASACFAPDQCQGVGLAVTVTRAPSLDLDAYLRTHWIGEDPTETTVQGHPALATSVEADEAAGLVWSPQPGVVIEINIHSSMPEELRKVIDGLRFTG